MAQACRKGPGDAGGKSLYCNGSFKSDQLMN